jgi:hypothetical protein
MKQRMAILLLALALPLSAQQPPRPADQPLPQLGTAEKVALQSLEKVKLDAQKQWQDASQQELTILREWALAHPGYHVNQQTFAVEADPPRPVVKPALPAQK